MRSWILRVHRFSDRVMKLTVLMRLLSSSMRTMERLSAEAAELEGVVPLFDLKWGRIRLLHNGLEKLNDCLDSVFAGREASIGFGCRIPWETWMPPESGCGGDEGSRLAA